MDEHLDKLAEKIEKKIIEKEQLEHRLQRAENRMEYLASKERKERTHRLITKGAAVESIIPETKGIGERAFYLAIESFFGNEDNRRIFCAELTRQTTVVQEENRAISERGK